MVRAEQGILYGFEGRFQGLLPELMQERLVLA
jgi:hypothetical protein